MKLYPDIPVELFVQMNGSSYQMVLQGTRPLTAEQDINLVFNALYNFGGTSQSTDKKPVVPEFVDHARSVATFWSDEEKMFTFFFYKFFFANADKFKGKKGGVYPAASVYATDMMKELLTKHTQAYNPKALHFQPDFYNNGTIRAEKPDDNYKEMALASGLSDKGNVTTADVKS